MNIRYLFLLILFSFTSCKSDKQDSSEIQRKPKVEEAFDKSKWLTKEGENYPYRDQMLRDVVYNDTIRTLNKVEILDLLGEPSYYRDDKNFLYYRINQKSILNKALHTKTMVIKFANEDSIEWIKIHE